MDSSILKKYPKFNLNDTIPLRIGGITITGVVKLEPFIEIIDLKAIVVEFSVNEDPFVIKSWWADSTETDDFKITNFLLINSIRLAWLISIVLLTAVLYYT